MISLSVFFYFDEIGEREKKGKLQVWISKSSATGLFKAFIVYGKLAQENEGDYCKLLGHNPNFQYFSAKCPSCS